MCNFSQWIRKLFFLATVFHLRLQCMLTKRKPKCALVILHLKHSQHVQRLLFPSPLLPQHPPTSIPDFHINFILWFLSGIVLHYITLLDPVYLHNSNATLKDINIVTASKHTF